MVEVPRDTVPELLTNALPGVFNVRVVTLAVSTAAPLVEPPMLPEPLDKLTVVPETVPELSVIAPPESAASEMMLPVPVPVMLAPMVIPAPLP